MLEWMGTYYKLLSNKYDTPELFISLFLYLYLLMAKMAGRSKTSLEKTWHDTPLISAKVEEDGTFAQYEGLSWRIYFG